MASGPVFIGGVSFSGKTQLRLMLNAHPAVHITRHTYFWRKVFNQYGDLSQGEHLDHCLDAIAATKQGKALQIDRGRVRAEFTGGSRNYIQLFSIIHKQNARAYGKSRWGIQQSFIECDADWLFAEMPAACILHVVRNPFDRIQESVSRSSRRTGKIGRETALWRLSARWAVRNSRRYPEQYRLVFWEKMLADPESVLKEVCAFFGEEVQPGMLETARKQMIPSGDRPKTRTLSPSEQAFIQAWAGKEMTALGYPLRQDRLSFKALLSLALRDYPLNTAGAVLYHCTTNKGNSFA